jgi:heme-degrading monooxygenase HmoA
MAEIASTPEPPYVAVVFTSTETDDSEGYADAADRMIELARRQPGFLGVDSARSDGVGITVSYWTTDDAVLGWKRNLEHTRVREVGRARWYESYELRVARVERAYGWTR